MFYCSLVAVVENDCDEIYFQTTRWQHCHNQIGSMAAHGKCRLLLNPWAFGFMGLPSFEMLTAKRNYWIMNWKFDDEGETLGSLLGY